MRKHELRIGFEHIGLENVDVAELPSRSGLKGVQKRRCLQYRCETHHVETAQDRAQLPTTERPLFRQNPIEQAMVGKYSTSLS